ncbi:putative hydrolase of HD superfamily [Salirhabdus euzebyi]|uniref:Putative hydrolase of HD superfamily n=1 Tax=Salirhabdus euzebyi TaxID=394506 RepID=A0A841Q6T1_9BACI|nr:HD domain-containing protein [Salirhabdus euzebyi]MBB6454120.1 putative hydrolase of HD superfamily [Salirhabdus euzebyi]
MNDVEKILQVIKLGEGLKKEIRHSWLSDGRKESVAEHTWRVSLMAILVEKKLKQKIDIEKLLKMIVIHDLVEVKAGDIPAFDTINNQANKLEKLENEIKAMEEIKEMLPEDIGQELFDLWMEFERKESNEAKVANALDKLEAQIQHNEADISTWLEVEKGMTFLLGQHTEFDSFLDDLKKEIEKDGEEKLIHSGVDVTKYKESIG